MQGDKHDPIQHIRHIDVWQIRHKDRAAHGGVVIEPAKNMKPSAGGFYVTDLWECHGLRHAPYCTCKAWRSTHDGLAVVRLGRAA